MTTLLISTYELGRQPFGLASPAAWLRQAGVEVACVDAAKEALTADVVRNADAIGFHLPMHTATRLAAPLIERARRWNPRARICCYGLYAALNEPYLRSLGVAAVMGGEFEQDLVAFVLAQPNGSSGSAVETRNEARPSGRAVPRLRFLVPDRQGLPSLTRYTSLQYADGSRRTVGYTEASRGCKHRCRHCPVVPVYGGQFRIVPVDIVLADVRAQVAAGAEHITFGDPDFFNGIGHARAVVNALARELPGVSYDVTIKVEHLLAHRADLELLRQTGCLFVTSAVESVDDRVLSLLEKGHTHDDFVRVAAACRAAGLVLSPTFLPFTPWTHLEGYCDLLRTIEELDLVEHVAPIQLGIRLLIPEGSRLLELAEIRQIVGPFDRATLAYPWTHPDPRVDALQQEVMELVGRRLTVARSDVFDRIADLAHRRAGTSRPATRAAARNRATVPYLNEPWYC